MSNIHFNEKKKTATLFLDISKAYDVCWRNGCLRKMGILGKTYHDIETFSTQSKLQEQQTGIPQGWIPSLRIFKIMINDQVEELKDIKNKLSQNAEDAAKWRTLKMDE